MAQHRRATMQPLNLNTAIGTTWDGENKLTEAALGPQHLHVHPYSLIHIYITHTIIIKTIRKFRRTLTTHNQHLKKCPA